jgi:hypothetical protein
VFTDRKDIVYFLFVVSRDYISGGGSFTCPSSGSSIVFLSLSSEKTGYIYINLGRATLYEFLTCLIILYRPAI